MSLEQRIFVRNSWDTRVAQSILDADEYRLRSLSGLRVNLERIMDVGAHIGSFTRCAKRHWPSASILAVEPAADSAAYFRLNLAQATGVVLEQVALVAEGGPSRVDLVDGDAENLGSRYVPELRGEQTPSDRPASRVQSTHVQALLRKHGWKSTDLLKLDCEGAEAVIVDELAVSGYLQRVRFICGEWHGRATIPRLATALSGSHHLRVIEGPHPLGLFFAVSRQESEPGLQWLP
jgi:FkbM family methyltransferase